MEKIGEGKTKAIFRSHETKYVIIQSKDSITAGDGAKKDELEGKAKFSTTTTCNVFRLLQLSGIPTHYVCQESEDSFRAFDCKMIPIEVIVRRLAAGSFVRRHPETKQGTKFDPLFVEFTFKSDQDHDPLITDEEILAMGLCLNGVLVDTSVIKLIKSMAIKAFVVLEKAWKAMDVALVDYKVEFGVTQEGEIVLADVIDNDSWRIWPKGDPLQMKDKQVYRNMKSTTMSNEERKLLANHYNWVANATAKFLDTILQPIPTGPLVGVIMGSQSDWETMKDATCILDKLGIPYETKIVSAHRTPERLFAYAKSAKSRGLKVIIAGAGGAAHLPGMVASLTSVPVLGIPIQSKALNGMDSLLSIAQMPGGIPVGTLAIGKAGAINGALLAASILCSSGSYPEISKRLDEYRENQSSAVGENPIDQPEPARGNASSIVRTHGDTKKFVETIVSPIGAKSVIGIIGGGQLARMISIAAAQLGYRTHIYCPDQNAPAFQVADDTTVADYTDKKSLNMFVGKVNVVTYEFENIPAESLEYVSNFVPVRPSPRILSVCQHRVMEKEFLQSIGVPTTNFRGLKSLEDLKEAANILGLPAVLKSATMGYDGKCQVMLTSDTNLEDAWSRLEATKLDTGSSDAILESYVEFSMEISVIVARDFHGAIAAFPVAENKHKNHILHQTIVPADVNGSVREQAAAQAKKIAQKMSLVGLLAVEMFVTKDGKVLVNELAPRPHNSGHWTIEGSQTSQFEQLICGLPLGDTTLLYPSVKTTNLLGNDVDRWLDYLSMENTHLHLYGKAEAREGRKMGHITQVELPMK